MGFLRLPILRNWRTVCPKSIYHFQKYIYPRKMVKTSGAHSIWRGKMNQTLIHLPNYIVFDNQTFKYSSLFVKNQRAQRRCSTFICSVLFLNKVTVYNSICTCQLQKQHENKFLLWFCFIRQSKLKLLNFQWKLIHDNHRLSNISP